VVRDSETFEIADLRLDPLRRKVTRQGVNIVLTNKEFMLLHLLVQRQGEALSRAVIASQVWDMNFDSDTNVVDVAIKRLRAKVDAPFEKKLIHTVRGIGYVFSEQP
jgi:two-component system copper resistance phosphate regulon response regulator CusR